MELAEEKTLKKQLEDKQKIIETRKNLEIEKKEKSIKAKQKELEIIQNPEDFTQITVIKKSDLVKNKKTQNSKDNEIILDSIENKFMKKELIRKREEEIEKRKYSYFNRKENQKNVEIDKTKQFFDERTIKKTFNKKNNEKIEKNIENKKKLEKKLSQSNLTNDRREKKDKDLLAAAIIKRPSSIVELKEQVVNSKREILNFENDDEQLAIKQKKKLKEFANIIKDKPVKIVIKTFVSKDEKDFNKFKKISKSRSLYIRAFLINQGISHNRIKIETNEENVTKNWKNEVILNFIGV